MVEVPGSSPVVPTRTEVRHECVSGLSVAIGPVYLRTDRGVCGVAVSSSCPVSSTLFRGVQRFAELVHGPRKPPPTRQDAVRLAWPGQRHRGVQGPGFSPVSSHRAGVYSHGCAPGLCGPPSAGSAPTSANDPNGPGGSTDAWRAQGVRTPARLRLEQRARTSQMRTPGGRCPPGREHEGGTRDLPHRPSGRRGVPGQHRHDPTVRLIPDLTGRRTGQAPYTTALRNALRREGFAFENVGYHVSSHSLRKSLSSELRWTLQIDEMVRSRLLGHRLQAFDGGSPTTARNYTQRMPQLTPLTAVAAALDATIVDEIGTLLVPTTNFNRIRWNGEILERGDLVEGRLREAGWLTREAPGLTVVDAAASLGVSRTTLNRWLNDGRIEGDLTATPGRHSAWRVSNEEVERLRLRQETRVSVANAATELGCGNQELWRRIRRGEIEAEQDLRSGDWSVSRETLEGLRGEYEARRRLYERAVPIAQAAVRLGVSITVVAYRINNGRLAVDPERDGNRRMVTLASIERELAAQAKPPTMRGRSTEGVDIVFAAEIARETGMTRLEILALCRSGVLVRRDRQYQFGVERESYETRLRNNR
jgi:predicted DNA-binding protein (UPF0251 family)